MQHLIMFKKLQNYLLKQILFPSDSFLKSFQLLGFSHNVIKNSQRSCVLPRILFSSIRLFLSLFLHFCNYYITLLLTPVVFGGQILDPLRNIRETILSPTTVDYDFLHLETRQPVKFFRFLLMKAEGAVTIYVASAPTAQNQYDRDKRDPAACSPRLHSYSQSIISSNQRKKPSFNNEYVSTYIM